MKVGWRFLYEIVSKRWFTCIKQIRTVHGQICTSSHGEPRVILVSEDNFDGESGCEIGGNDIGDDFCGLKGRKHGVRIKVLGVSQWKEGQNQS